MKKKLSVYKNTYIGIAPSPYMIVSDNFLFNRQHTTHCCIDISRYDIIEAQQQTIHARISKIISWHAVRLEQRYFSEAHLLQNVFCHFFHDVQETEIEYYNYPSFKKGLISVTSLIVQMTVSILWNHDPPQYPVFLALSKF